MTICQLPSQPKMQCQSRANIIYGSNGLRAAADGIEAIREMRYKSPAIMMKVKYLRRTVYCKLHALGRP